MRKQQATVNQTFSLPLDISKETKKEEFCQAYLMANEDEGQNEALEDWIGTLGDGIK